MIKVKFSETERIIRVVVKNHAESVVCSAVSTLATGLKGTLLNYKHPFEVVKERDGYLEVKIYKDKDEKKNVILNVVINTIKISLLQLQMSYPKLLKVSSSKVDSLDTLP